MDKDILGQAFYDRQIEFNNKLPDEIEDMEAARLAFWKAIADEFINHVTTYADVPATGLVAPNGAVTGSAKIK